MAYLPKEMPVLRRRKPEGCIDVVNVLCPWPRLGRVLVVGDGNFEFACALMDAAFDGEYLTATAFEAAPVDDAAAARCARLEAMGAKVRHGVDGTRLRATVHNVYDAICFNFPYACVTGRRPQIDDNRSLLVVARAGRGDFKVP